MHIHTPSFAIVLITPPRSSTPALNCPCNELQWMGLLVWRHLRTLCIGGTSCRPSSPGNTFRMMFSMKCRGKNLSFPHCIWPSCIRPSKSAPLLLHPLTTSGPFCFPNYSLQRGGLRFETCGGGWGLALTHEAPEHPQAWDMSLWQDTCYFSILDQPPPPPTTHYQIKNVRSTLNVYHMPLR